MILILSFKRFVGVIRLENITMHCSCSSSQSLLGDTQSWDL